MKEHKLVTSPEISLKLKQIGCPQNTYFRWVRQMDEINGELKYIDEYELYNAHDQFTPYVCENDEENEKSSFAAYTITELLEILPKEINESFLMIIFDKDLKKWHLQYKSKIGNEFSGLWYFDLSEAISKLIISLNQKGLIKFNTQGE